MSDETTRKERIRALARRRGSSAFDPDDLLGRYPAVKMARPEDWLLTDEQWEKTFRDTQVASAPDRWHEAERRIRSDRRARALLLEAQIEAVRIEEACKHRAEADPVLRLLEASLAYLPQELAKDARALLGLEEPGPDERFVDAEGELRFLLGSAERKAVLEKALLLYHWGESDTGAWWVDAVDLQAPYHGLPLELRERLRELCRQWGAEDAPQAARFCELPEWASYDDALDAFELLWVEFILDLRR